MSFAPDPGRPMDPGSALPFGLVLSSRCWVRSSSTEIRKQACRSAGGATGGWPQRCHRPGRARPGPAGARSRVSRLAACLKVADSPGSGIWGGKTGGVGISSLRGAPKNERNKLAPFPFTRVWTESGVPGCRDRQGKLDAQTDSRSGCRGAGGRAGPQGCPPEFQNALGRPGIPLPEVTESQALWSHTRQQHAVPSCRVDVGVLPPALPAG